MNNKTLNIVIILSLCYGTMLLGALFTQFTVAEWYPTLNKPTWGPPNWAFRIVWPILYTLMALSAWLVQRKQFYHLHNSAFYWFVIQLFFNLAWSFCFFVLKNPGLAFIDILLLFFSILITIVNFGKLVPLAGWLLLPYLLWVSYATALNLIIWTTNS
jgi:tryptophan-rich sensory protein